jgi:hypothetical protein
MSKLAVITSKDSNDLLNLFDKLSIPYFKILYSKIDTLEIEKYSGLVVLADEYPMIVLPKYVAAIQELINHFKHLKKPVFCEFFPLQNIITSEIIEKPYTRLVALDKKSPILKNIDPLTLFDVHLCKFLVNNSNVSPLDSIEELLTFGRVAGVYKADFGLPSQTYVGIGQDESIIFSTTKVSDFEILEFRLKVKFGQLMINICEFLCKDWCDVDFKLVKNPYDSRNFMDRMKPAKDNEESRRKLYIDTLIKGLNWFEKSNMFESPLGKGGVYEGFTSGFDPAGKKEYKKYEKFDHRTQRGDCTSDTAFCFFLSTLLPIKGSMTKPLHEKYMKIYENLFDELYTYWQHYPDDKGIFRGFFGWANSPYDMYVAYSDDNGRDTFQSLIYSYIQKDPELFKKSNAAVIALGLTTGKNGHRWTRTDLNHYYSKKGRKWFRTHKVKRGRYKSPHYDAWTFASVLYGAYMAKDQSFIELIKKGIYDYMAKFPKVHLEHSTGDDFSKLLVAAVILYQITKDPNDLKNVQSIVDFFAQYQDKKTGAFPERDPYNMHARTEKTNEKYGTGESALYTSMEDTISDQLYSSGFLAMALFLAYKTGDVPNAKPMLVKFLDYLCAIQLDSKNPQLDGTWTRGFDYYWGEPYGANGDVGWGAYSIETGWTVGPILTSIGLYLTDVDLFEPLPSDLQEKVCAEYQKEKEFQINLDDKSYNWKQFTPKPVKHQNSMNMKEIQEIKKIFKRNSIHKL